MHSMIKRIAVLGCTGSIGSTALKIIRNNPDRFKAVFLANNKNEKQLLGLAKEFGVNNIFCRESKLSVINGKRIRFDENLLSYPETYENADIVINGIAGIGGLAPTVAAIEANKIVATANKESIVSAGNYINDLLDKTKAELRPLDSEHSTVWQCIDKAENVKRILLTASGGAFRDYTPEMLTKATATDALRHPNWVMGKKVTIDCATLVNKGMEIIEAKRIFRCNNVDAVLHRESIVHSLVEMKDGALICGVSEPDMILPIQYALTYPERIKTGIKELDLSEIGAITFKKIDEQRFPCFGLCKKVAEFGDYAGAVLAAADETAVELFLKNTVDFYGISACIENALQKFGLTGTINNINEVYRIQKDVREYTLKSIGE